MIEVVFANESRSALAMRLTQPAPLPAAVNPELAADLLFGILEKAGTGAGESIDPTTLPDIAPSGLIREHRRSPAATGGSRGIRTLEGR